MKELLQFHALIHSLDIDPLPEEHVKASKFLEVIDCCSLLQVYFQPIDWIVRMSAYVCCAILSLFKSLTKGWSSFCLMISTSSIILNSCHGCDKLYTSLLYLQKIGFCWIGGSWCKSPTAIMPIPANIFELEVPKIYFSFWWICNSLLFDTIDISSIINSFSSLKLSLHNVFFWSGNRGKLIPASFGIARPVFTVMLCH